MVAITLARGKLDGIAAVTTCSRKEDNNAAATAEQAWAEHDIAMAAELNRRKRSAMRL